MTKIKLGAILTERKQSINDPKGRDLELIGVSNSIGLHKSKAKRIADLSRYKLIKKNWFAYNPMRVNVGSIGFAQNQEHIGIVSPDYVVFSCSEKIMPEYLLYLLKSDEGIEVINKNASGAVRKRLYFKDLAKIEIILPELEIQKRRIETFRKIKSLRSEIAETTSKNSLLAQFKQSILQEAIQGKLTEEWRARNPELVSGSNSAAALLENIKAEKAQLVKEKKIKKEKDLPPMTEEEIPFKLPEGWALCKIPQILDLKNDSLRRGPFGSSLKKSMFEPCSKKTTKVYEQQNAIKKDFSLGSYFISTEKYPNLKSFLAGPGDIIISCAGTIGETYKLPSNAPIGIINQALLKIRLNKKVILDEFFIFMFKSQLQVKVNTDAKGTAMKNMGSVKYLKNNLIFGLPPLIEQEAIVNKVKDLLEKFQTIEKEIEKSKFQAEMLLQAVLKEAFEDKKKESKDNGQSIDALFESLNYDYEVAAVVLLTEQHFGYTYGKKFIHKMFSNIELLERLPVFKELQFKEHAWGMYSPILQKTIDNKKFINYQSLANGKKSLKVNPESVAEITNWIHDKENKTFVNQVNNMLKIYEKPLIDRDMNRIELLNTVLECMVSLETDDFEKIRYKMKKWKMLEGNYRTKADKFKETETLHMIHFIKDMKQNN